MNRLSEIVLATVAQPDFQATLAKQGTDPMPMNPDQFAALLLKHDQNWSQARLTSAFNNAYDQHVALQQKIPVYINYFTLRVNDDGSISTFRDLYGHDARMAAALRL